MPMYMRKDTNSIVLVYEMQKSNQDIIKTQFT